MSLTVLLVDDQSLVRTGFRMILEAEDDIEVVGEAGTGRQAVEQARALKPDVILMDVRMPEMDGIEATRQLLADGTSDSKVVMLTTFDMDEYVYDALRAGASGFLLKDVPPEQLVSGIHAVGCEQAPCRLDPVDLRHAHVHEDDIRFQAQRLRHGVGAVGSLAGDLEAGPRPEGGYRLHATLPVGSA